MINDSTVIIERQKYFCECDDIGCILNVNLSTNVVNWLTNQAGFRLIVNGCQDDSIAGEVVKVGKGYAIIKCTTTTRS